MIPPKRWAGPQKADTSSKAAQQRAATSWLPHRNQSVIPNSQWLIPGTGTLHSLLASHCLKHSIPQAASKATYLACLSQWFFNQFKDLPFLLCVVSIVRNHPHRTIRLVVCCVLFLLWYIYHLKATTFFDLVLYSELEINKNMQTRIETSANNQ